MKIETFLVHRTLANHTSEKHSHRYWEIVLTDGSAGRLDFRTKILKLASGQVHAVAPFTKHTWYGEEECLHYCLGVNGVELADVEEGSFIVDERLQGLFYSIRNEFSAKDNFYRNLTELKAREIVIFLKRLPFSRNRSNTVPDDVKAMDKVKELIDGNFTRKLDLDALSDSVFLNKDYLRHAFKNEFGVSPIQYLISKRIERAKARLKEPGTTIRDIASECGFENEYYFSRLFKKFTGLSPLAYRKATP